MRGCIVLAKYITMQLYTCIVMCEVVYIVVFYRYLAVDFTAGYCSYLVLWLACAVFDRYRVHYSLLFALSIFSIYQYRCRKRAAQDVKKCRGMDSLFCNKLYGCADSVKLVLLRCRLVCKMRRCRPLSLHSCAFFSLQCTVLYIN